MDVQAEDQEVAVLVEAEAVEVVAQVVAPWGLVQQEAVVEGAMAV